jgi:hypothetical protein
VQRVGDFGLVKRLIIEQLLARRRRTEVEHTEQLV